MVSTKILSTLNRIHSSLNPRRENNTIHINWFSCLGGPIGRQQCGSFARLRTLHPHLLSVELGWHQAQRKGPSNFAAQSPLSVRRGEASMEVFDGIKLKDSLRCWSRKQDHRELVLAMWHLPTRIDSPRQFCVEGQHMKNHGNHRCPHRTRAWW